MKILSLLSVLGMISAGNLYEDPLSSMSLTSRLAETILTARMRQYLFKTYNRCSAGFGSKDECQKLFKIIRLLKF